MLDYQQMIQKKNYMQDPEFTKFFFKSMSGDGRRVTAEDMKKTIADLRMKDEVASAQEFVEKTAGKSMAPSFTLD